MKRIIPFFFILFGLLFLGCKKDRFENDFESSAIIYDNVVVVDSNLFKLSSTQAELENGIYKYRGSANQKSLFRPGNILLGYTGEGYLRKVTQVSISGGDLVFQTVQATLEEAFKRLDFHSDLDLGNAFSASKNQDFKLNIPLPSGFLTHPNEKSWINLSNGNLLLDPNFSFDIDLTDSVVNYMKLGTDRSKIRLDYTVDFGVKQALFSTSLDSSLFKKDLIKVNKVLVTWVGYVPIVTVPELTFSLSATGLVNYFNTEIDIVSEHIFSAGIEYSDQTVIPYADYDSNNSLDVGAVGEDFNFNFFLRATPKLTFKIYGVAGPYLSTPVGHAGFSGTIDAITEDFDANVTLKAFTRYGIMANLFKFFEGQNYYYQNTHYTNTLYEFPYQISHVSGDLQSANANQTLSEPIIVKAKDSRGNPIPFVNVYFSPSDVGASVSQQVVKTNILGEASVHWTIGSNASQFLYIKIRGADGVDIDNTSVQANVIGVTPPCENGIQDAGETGVDCGGSCPNACESCSDGIQNGDETGVDCGGSCPSACPSCTDGILNGLETSIDCGGICPPCSTSTCFDGIQNGDETGIDCGGSCVVSCPSGSTCSDGVQNGDETGVDCGGSCPSVCGSISAPFTGRIWNMDGDSAGAWDLLAHTQRFLSESDGLKDMANTTPIGTPIQEFNIEFEAKNSTRFVKITDAEYNSITDLTSAQNIYSGYTPQMSYNNLNTFDKYLAKIRGANQYALIKITFIVETTTDDFDYIDFQYQIID